MNSESNFSFQKSHLLIPQNKTPIVIEETPENERIRAQLTEEIVEQIRLSVNKSLDKVKNNK